MLAAAASAATPRRRPSSRQPGAAVRSTPAAARNVQADGARQSGEGLAPYRADISRTYSIQRSGAGRRVDGISFTVHPRTVVEVPSPLGADPAGAMAARPPRPAARFPGPIIDRDVFQIARDMVLSSAGFVVSTAWTPSRRRAQLDGRTTAALGGCTGGRLAPLC